MCKDKNDKEELQLRIIRHAFMMFTKHGIKDVKMDDIAHSLSISKRTIYELFENKEQILFEGLRLGAMRMQQQAKEIIRSTQNPIELIIKIYKLYFGNLDNVNRKFFIDLHKYPHVRELQEKKKKINDHSITSIMNKGKEEGYFRQDANFEILLYILKRDMEFISSTTLFEEYSLKDLAQTFILTYLRGISTPKGIETIDKYMQ